MCLVIKTESGQEKNGIYKCHAPVRSHTTPQLQCSPHPFSLLSFQANLKTYHFHFYEAFLEQSHLGTNLCVTDLPLHSFSKKLVHLNSSVGRTFESVASFLLQRGTCGSEKGVNFSKASRQLVFRIQSSSEVKVLLDLELYIPSHLFFNSSFEYKLCLSNNLESPI